MSSDLAVPAPPGEIITRSGKPIPATHAVYALPNLDDFRVAFAGWSAHDHADAAAWHADAGRTQEAFAHGRMADALTYHGGTGYGRRGKWRYGEDE